MQVISKAKCVCYAVDEICDGIIATPLDAVKFMRGLMEGKLLSDSSFNQMMTWVNDGEGKPVYGLGLYHVTYSGKDGYGHGGAGAGAGCGFNYFPGIRFMFFWVPISEH